jgi:ABC-type oligopeptide transport system ATPase subunit
MLAPLLDIANLTVSFHTERGQHEVLSDVSLAVQRGAILGIVGESGSGKSVTALAVMRLLGEQGEMRADHIRFDGRDLLGLDGEAMRHVRGGDIAMIFQEPMTSLHPLARASGTAAACGAGSRHPVAGGCRHSISRKPVRRSSTSAVRRHASARDDCHGAGRPPATADRRRTDDSA